MSCRDTVVRKGRIPGCFAESESGGGTRDWYCGMGAREGRQGSLPTQGGPQTANGVQGIL